jgi:hypothetical protein
MLDLGRTEDAQAVISGAQASLHPRRDTRLRHRASILEAKLALRFRRDPRWPAPLWHGSSAIPLGGLASVREHAETWLGLASLFERDGADAAAVLRRTVESMPRCRRRLLLPVATVYLAEAEWRLGEEEAADRAADIALEAARFQGSDHLLLGALRDFRSVAWRRVESEARPESPWHRLARVMRSPRGSSDPQVTSLGPALVEVIEFGGTELLVEGAAVRPKLTKGHTLLALLAACTETEAPRKTAIGALFESGSDASTMFYLRLAVRAARETLPDGAELTLDRQMIRFSPSDALTGESVRFQSLVAAAQRLAGAERLGTRSTAPDLYRRGSYLGTEASPWVGERRRELEDQAEEALFDTAGTAHELAEYDEAAPRLLAGWPIAIGPIQMSQTRAGALLHPRIFSSVTERRETAWVRRQHLSRRRSDVVIPFA